MVLVFAGSALGALIVVLLAEFGVFADQMSWFGAGWGAASVVLGLFYISRHVPPGG